MSRDNLCIKGTVVALVGLFSLVDQVRADERDIAGHTDKTFHLDTVVVESSALQDTLFNSAQSVSVVSGRDLDEKARSNLGDTLAQEPGITSSNFGPGREGPSFEVSAGIALGF